MHSTFVEDKETDAVQFLLSKFKKGLFATMILIVQRNNDESFMPVLGNALAP